MVYIPPFTVLPLTVVSSVCQLFFSVPPNYKPKKNGKKWVEGKKYLNTVVPKVDKVAPKILMQKMEEILK